MGVEPPFQYNNKSRHGFIAPSDKGFNPKAVTQASWSPPRPRSKPDGPLISAKEFNRHPDSYFVVPYGNLNAKHMSPNTKTKVKWTRLVQLFLRVCALLGAAGLLVCVICIKGTDPNTGWIIRVPPSVAILHAVYAIYHLARSAKGRTPASSASYMLFAAIMDVGLVPFLAFTAMMARMQYTEPASTQGRWTTLFGEDDATYKVIYSTFLISTTNGGIHLASLVISIYLGVIFRQISRLPPDMNPLEDNLTSRHKRNKSSMIETSTTQASTAISTPVRGSRVDDPLVSPVRSVPFMHTRNESHSSITNVPHPNFSPRVSQTNISAPFYEQPPSHQSSRSHFQDTSTTQQPAYRNSRSQFPSLNHLPSAPPSNPASKTTTATTTTITRSLTKSSSVYSTSTTPSRPRSIVSDNNWITYPSSPSPSPPRQLKHLKNPSYQPLSQTSPFEYTSSNSNTNLYEKENENILIPKPLEMHPPTPPLEHKKRRQANGYRPLTPGTGNSGTAAWGTGPGTVGIGKARAWGTGGAGRVVSRSGVEIGESGILPSGGMRAREVSGKVMEEGRGGGGWR